MSECCHQHYLHSQCQCTESHFQSVDTSHENVGKTSSAQLNHAWPYAALPRPIAPLFFRKGVTESHTGALGLMPTPGTRYDHRSAPRRSLPCSLQKCCIFVDNMPDPLRCTKIRLRKDHVHVNLVTETLLQNEPCSERMKTVRHHGE